MPWVELSKMSSRMSFVIRYEEGEGHCSFMVGNIKNILSTGISIQNQFGDKSP